MMLANWSFAGPLDGGDNNTTPAACFAVSMSSCDSAVNRSIMITSVSVFVRPRAMDCDNLSLKPYSAV